MAGSIVPLKSAFGRNRMRVCESEASRRPLVDETLPRAFQSLPLSIEYSQAPLAVSAAMTAMPSTAPSSTSVIRLPPPLAMTLAMSDPAPSTSSSSNSPRAIFPELSRMGASLTGVTVRLAVSIAELKAVVPPLLLESPAYRWLRWSDPTHEMQSRDRRCH